MTSNDISNFLTSMSEAKRAFDAEPMYQKQIAELEKDKQRLGETIAARELRIHELKRNEEVITQALRSAEVERDDAGFRALEEADKVQGLLTLVRQYVGDGLKAISAVEGSGPVAIVSETELGKLREDNRWGQSANDDLHRRCKELEEMVQSSQNEAMGYATELQKLKDDVRLSGEQLHRPFASPSDTSSSGDAAMDPWSNKPTDGIGRQLDEGQRAVDPTIASTPSSAIPQEVS